jgi:peroxiredoxin
MAADDGRPSLFSFRRIVRGGNMTEELKKRRKSMITLGLIFAILFGYVFASSYMRTGGGCTQGPGTGNPAPDFSIPSMDGSTVALADYQGKVLVLNFWASWCPPCRKELPSLQSLYKKLKDREDFAFLAISCDEEIKDVAEILEKRNVEIPVAYDPDRKIAFLYGVYKFPETFFIDKKGTIRHKFVGPREWTDLDLVRTLEGMLAE